MAEFISADISKIAKFESDSVEAIAEFNSIKDKFESINATLLGKWQGEGADAYRNEAAHILENIGGIKDILDSINNSVVKDIKNNYLELDNALGEFNRDPSSGEEVEG
ncbi:MAG: hypothetical protein NC126_03200 [Clostridium sp.]|nr:hypothetical protein [Clostridium sp.]